MKFFQKFITLGMFPGHAASVVSVAEWLKCRVGMQKVQGWDTEGAGLGRRRCRVGTQKVQGWDAEGAGLEPSRQNCLHI